MSHLRKARKPSRFADSVEGCVRSHHSIFVNCALRFLGLPDGDNWLLGGERNVHYMDLSFGREKQGCFRILGSFGPQDRSENLRVGAIEQVSCSGQAINLEPIVTNDHVIEL